jgi:hypothetical protein
MEQCTGRIPSMPNMKNSGPHDMKISKKNLKKIRCADATAPFSAGVAKEQPAGIKGPVRYTGFSGASPSAA